MPAEIFACTACWLPIGLCKNPRAQRLRVTTSLKILLVNNNISNVPMENSDGWTLNGLWLVSRKDRDVCGWRSGVFILIRSMRGRIHESDTFDSYRMIARFDMYLSHIVI